MYFLRKSDCLFLNPNIHKEVGSSKIDLTKYIPVSDDFFQFCLEKRSLGYQIYIKDDMPALTEEPIPSYYHSLNENGDWILSPEKEIEKNKQDIIDKINNEKCKLEKVKTDLNYNFAMGRKKEYENYRKQALNIESNIAKLTKKLKENNDG